MANKRNEKPLEGGAEFQENSLAVEMGRIAKLFALYVLKDVGDESKKVTRLRAVGFSAQEIASMLNKTVANVHTQISQARHKLR